MMDLDAAWGAVAVSDGDFGDDQPPAPGTYVAQLTSSRTGTSKKGEFYLAITLALQSGQKWDIYKEITKQGTIHEGRAKSAKILLRGLGLPEVPPSQVGQALKSVENRHYTVEVKQSTSINALTGQFYVNTDVQGPAQGWGHLAPQSDVTPPPAAVPVPPQAPMAQFPVAGQPQPVGGPAAPGQQWGNDIPWDQPAQS